MSFGYRVLGFGSGGGAATYDIECLIVGGGAGSGPPRLPNSYGSGGGGAGGYRTDAALSLTGGNIFLRYSSV